MDQRCPVEKRESERPQRLRKVWIATAIAISLTLRCADLARSQAVGSQGQSSDATDIAQIQATTVRELLDPIATSVVRVRNRDRLCCLGTIVGDGWVISKRSELSGSLICVAADGTEVTGTIVASDSFDDLALLKLSTSKSNAESFSQAVDLTNDTGVDAGDVLFSVGQQSNPLSTGIATVAPQAIPIQQPACRDCVDLGVTVSPQTSEVEVKLARDGDKLARPQSVAGTRIERVYPRTVGERIGLLQGDLLVSINQQRVSDAKVLRSIGSGVRVGQRLEVIVVRAGSVEQLDMKIDHFSRRVYHDRWGGGPFSERRFGFGATIVHDSLLQPDQCGSPVVDLDGKLVGINIARSMRVATLAVPADRVLAFVNRFKPDSN